MYRVLLVDDEPAAISMERRIIERRSETFQIVAEAYSVEEAMEAYRAKRPRRADQIRNAAGKAGNLRGGQRLFGF